ncbi:ATR checkpoint kinase Rad3 [Schizosaccharomyces pombe]|uniref:Protein kinase rad3 n=1 Tax=Schizosaccharomyces pombe (strain 972 / ATCC 24843) TaxID=284812 RepID=RAD3_SCHPO|nr:ATR checkpoint kinase Rad3 [Schizosaccharomyces pombe]Q02099.2 RecName: Full=Protein kinase rad3; AltName: Full=DNA repair protein rad3 [Schizosaccharomyces pombe 972h-]CAB40165.1 ATR checkpoint kinase Rad3 [Schizosaccharomyces pombe]|eukprot:NP_595357.1 ATR checkpoint kinase Rad3 [Schizosaccharomyces pombe]
MSQHAKRKAGSLDLSPRGLDDRQAFGQLLKEVLALDKEHELGRSNSLPSMTSELVEVLIEVGLLAFKHDDSKSEFISPKMLKEAHLSLQALMLILKRSPTVLREIKSSVTLLDWILPRTISLFADIRFIKLFDSLKEFHKLIYQLISEKSFLWDLYASFMRYWKYYITNVSSIVLQITNATFPYKMPSPNSQPLQSITPNYPTHREDKFDLLIINIEEACTFFFESAHFFAQCSYLKKSNFPSPPLFTAWTWIKPCFFNFVILLKRISIGDSQLFLHLHSRIVQTLCCFSLNFIYHGLPICEKSKHILMSSINLTLGSLKKTYTVANTAISLFFLSLFVLPKTVAGLFYPFGVSLLSDFKVLEQLEPDSDLKKAIILFKCRYQSSEIDQTTLRAFGEICTGKLENTLFSNSELNLFLLHYLSLDNDLSNILKVDFQNGHNICTFAKWCINNNLDEPSNLKHFREMLDYYSSHNVTISEDDLKNFSLVLCTHVAKVNEKTNSIFRTYEVHGCEVCNSFCLLFDERSLFKIPYHELFCALLKNPDIISSSVKQSLLLDGFFRWSQHCSNFNKESMLSLREFIMKALASTSRCLRVVAAKVLPIFIKGPNNLDIVEFHKESKALIFNTLKILAVENTAILETVILSWISLSRVVEEEELHFVLLEVISSVINSGIFYQGIGLSALQQIASTRHISVWQLLSPYWPTVSVAIVQGMGKKPNIASLFAQLMNISEGDFLIRTQAYTLPFLVLTKNKALIVRIAELSQSDVATLCLTNMHKILASLLTTDHPNLEESVMLLLSLATSDFEKVDLTSLLRSDPISITVELLQLYQNDVPHEKIENALRKVAMIVSQVVNDEDLSNKELLYDFFNNHILGILAEFSNILNDLKGKTSINEKIKTIVGIEKMLSLCGGAVKLGLPQILSNLQSAFQNEHLRFYAIKAWFSLILATKEPEYSSIAGLSLVILPPLFPYLEPQEAELVIQIFDFISSDTHKCLQGLKWAIPTSLDSACFSLKAKEIFCSLQNEDFYSELQSIIKCLTNENEPVCYLGLQKLELFFQAKVDELHDTLNLDISNEVLDQLLRCLLDCCVKYASTNMQISYLAAKNLGELGAIDPSRAKAQHIIKETVVLDNFENGEESLKFILDFMQSQLIPAFLVTTDTKAQGFLAYALQEFLKLGGFKSAVINKKKGLTVVTEHWMSLPDLSKRVLIPFLTSKYHLTPIPKIDIRYPIYKENVTIHTWMQLFSLKLMEYAHSQNAEKIFGICSKVVKDQEVNIPCFLLPFLVLNVILTESELEVNKVIEEFQLVINQPGPDGLNSVGQQRYTSFVDVFFKIVDYLNKWLRMRKKRNWDRRSAIARKENRYMSVEDATSRESSISKVESFLSRFPSKTLGIVSLNCGFHARALFYWEQHIRNATAPYAALESDYRVLQEIYAGIDDPDEIEAVSLNFHDYSFDQQLLLHENSGTWDSALSCYEIIIQKDPENKKAKIGLLNSMLQSGHYESLVLSLDSFIINDNHEYSKMLNLGIEASWRSLSIDSLKKCLSKSNLESFEAKLGSIFYQYLRKDSFAELTERLQPLYVDAATAIANTGAHSAYDCYDILSKLHAINDFSRIAETDGIVSDNLDIVLRRRLSQVAPYGKFKHQILSTHLVGYEKFENTKKTAEIYLEIARISRKNGQFQRAFNAILKAMDLDKPLATIEHAQWWWHQGQHRKAISELNFSLNNNMFDLVDEHEERPKNRKETLGNPLKGKVFLKLTKWLGKAGQLGLKDLETYYHKAVEIYSECENTHYYLGHHRVLMYEEEQKLPVNEQSERFLSGELVTRIINEFGRSLYYGTNHIYESMPKLLTLWLDFGAEELRLSKDDGEKYFREHIISSRKKSLELMNSNVCRLSMKIPQYFFLVALSQMISRVCHPNNKVYKILEHIIANVVASYPGETLWQLMATIKSTSQKRSLRGKSILNVLHSRKLSMSSKVDIKALSQSAILITEKLINLCNTRINSKSVKMSLKDHFRLSFDDPVDLVIPAKSFLDITLPAKDANRASHYPFPKTQPTLLKFEDEVDIMNSLQKPRKVYVRGTDGNLYPFLCKPKDDLRKDARLMEFNNLICKILRKDQEANRRNLCIRTYVVIPLNEECGFIEWVNHTRPFREILLKSYRQKNIPISYQEIKVDLDFALRSPNPGDIFEKKILPKFPPVFYEWFVESFPEPNNWVTSRQNYCRTLAVMSIVGYVLGLGDRHGENILFDEFTGEAIHVDFNCLFDKGLTFEKPEKVPFRLTHNMVDAMGPTGYEGGFRKASEITMRLLRSNQDTLMSVLESFLHDPLVEWNRKKSSSKYPNNEANEVLDIIRKKFQGFMPGETIPLSIEGQIQELIKSAVNPKNLVEMYIGWAAYF